MKSIIPAKHLIYHYLSSIVIGLCDMSSTMYTLHERYAFLPSDLKNYAFRAGRHAFQGGGKNGRICKHAAKFGELTDVYTNL